MRLLPILGLAGCLADEDCLAPIDVIDRDTGSGVVVLLDDPTCRSSRVPTQVLVNRYPSNAEDLCDQEPGHTDGTLDVALQRRLTRWDFPLDLNDPSIWSIDPSEVPRNTIGVSALRRKPFSTIGRTHPSWRIVWRIGEPDTVRRCWEE